MRKRVILIIVFLLLGYEYLPSLFHRIYRYNTEKNEIWNNRVLYNKVSTSANESDKNKTTKDSLYLWFQLRGLGIDEDHIPKTTNERWEEIFAYWRQ